MYLDTTWSLDHFWNRFLVPSGNPTHNWSISVTWHTQWETITKIINLWLRFQPSLVMVGLLAANSFPHHLGLPKGSAPIETRMNHPISPGLGEFSLTLIIPQLFNQVPPMAPWSNLNFTTISVTKILKVPCDCQMPTDHSHFGRIHPEPRPARTSNSTFFEPVSFWDEASGQFSAAYRYPLVI